MTVPTKTWRLAERLHPDLLQHLLTQRHLESPSDQQSFFNPQLSHLPSPGVFPQLNTAVERIAQAIAEQQPVVVWGDFDADGVTSTAILWQTMHSLGAKVMPYIPNREHEGHGFSAEGLQKIADQGTKLIITCDHGITAFEGVEQLTNLGMEVIITDHHEPLQVADLEEQQATSDENEIDPPRPSLVARRSAEESCRFPAAVAVIHPLQTNLGQLAGCGVAYMLAYAVWLNQKNLPDTLDSRTAYAETYMELAAIGTIADMMPLTGMNRVIAAQGLARLANTKRPGLQQLYIVAGIDSKTEFSAYDVGFTIAPRLNAPGRLADALESLRLLCTNDSARAITLAKQLNFLNAERQDLLAEVATQAKQRAEQSGHDGVFVLSDPDWPAGVCGLAAGKIVEAFYRPAVVMEEQGQTSRGSARSIKGFDITAALTQIKQLLISFGGHAMAAGFVAKTQDIPRIQAELSKLLFDQLEPQQLNPALDIDAQVNLFEMNQDLYNQLQKFEPCGIGNRQPLFMAKGLIVTDFKTMGADAKHLRLTLDDPATDSVENIPATIENMDLTDIQQIFSPNPLTPRRSLPLPAVAFSYGHLAEQLSPQTKVDIVFTLDENTWQSRRNLQLMIKDIRLSV